MKRSHILYGKKLLPLLTLLLLVLSLLNALSLNMVRVSAGEYPAIYIDPATTVDPTLTPGKNYTISIKTDYTGDDIWSWTFTLTYNPDVLHGGIRKTDTWTGDNVTTMFNTTGTPVVQNSEEVYVNQTLMTRITRRTEIWIGNGETRTFYTTQPVFPGTETVLVDGYPPSWWGLDYTIDYSTGNITFDPAPEIGKEIKVAYDIWGDYTINYEEGNIIFTTPLGEVKIKATYLYGGITNGDLITKDKDPTALFTPGTFNNTIGKLSLPGALFFSFTIPFPTTSGPGTLANVTFTVVGKGDSDITLGPKTALIDGDTYYIIKSETMPDHIQHGFFGNVVHDIAVTSVTVSPNTVKIGEPVSINVSVTNEGEVSETFKVTTKVG